MYKKVKAKTKVTDLPNIPLTVPKECHQEYLKNYLAVTANSSVQRLFLFAGDQKIEHLNKDFYGNNIALDDANPEHLFAIANSARIGAFASQLGLIARHGNHYKNINYIVKLNAKTNLIPTQQEDPLSLALHTIDQVIAFKQNTGLNVVGVGYTLYPGSKHEAVMMAQAADLIYQAHQHGLITVLWCYPRGKAVTNELDISIVSGAAGIGACLGADFIKINPPEASDGFESAKLLSQATLAAGNAGIICSGGLSQEPKKFLETIYHQLHTGGARGAAIGRNIHQKELCDAITFCEAIAALIIDDVDLDEALKILTK